MHRKSLRKYNNSIRVLIVALTALSAVGCNSGDETTEVIKMDDVIPEASRDYNYNDTTTNEKTEEDLFLKNLRVMMQREVGGLSKNKSVMKDAWKYIPDRLQTDSSFSRTFTLDSAIIQFKMWQFEDSLRTINALYNWLDCFGANCSSVSIGDDINVSPKSFLLLQDNQHIYFIQSPGMINEHQWLQFIEHNKKNTSWNYILFQTPGGTIQWKEQPD